VPALDALDAAAFRDAVRQLPPGPVAIIQEGLLMYLDDAEKARLATNVRSALLERGGVWATADIYVRSDAPFFREERTKRFLEQHGVDEKKFADWAAAETFFTAQGFSIARKLSPSSDARRIRETWVLEAVAS
jgi:O-methyltransferase involved in polyketide biosynthesis